MNHTNLQNAEKALKITTLLTIIVAGYEVFMLLSKLSNRNELTGYCQLCECKSERVLLSSDIGKSYSSSERYPFV